MSVFSGAIDAYLSGDTVRSALGVKLDFASESYRLWTGPGELSAGGEIWHGMAGFGGVDGLEQDSGGGQANAVNLSLSGIDATLLPAFRENFEAEAKGRRATVYLIFFRGTDDIPTDDPVALWSGVMRQPSITVAEDGTRTIAATCENLFAQRRRPRFGLLTDTDQRQRHPGDKGLEFVTGLKNTTVAWPTF